MDKKFNQAEYIKEFNKTHYSTFKVDLKKEEKEELDNFLKKKNLTKAGFLRNAIKDLKERGKINMKINELYKLNELNTKAGLLLNNSVDNDFYDFYMTKNLEWLLENKEKIENDYINNIAKLKFDIILNTDLIERQDLICGLINSSIEEFSNYINFIPYKILNERTKKDIEKKFEKFKSISNEYERINYFDTICR